jgi:serine/threonine protein kinase
MATNVNNSPLSNKPLYEELSVIGTGAYGTVYKGFDLKTSRIVAMKRIRIQITEEGLPISTIREIAYLKQLEKFDHVHIVKLLDVINGPRLASEQSVILIFEFIDFDLSTYLRSFNNTLDLNKIIDLMKQLVIGVDFLHSNRIVHVRLWEFVLFIFFEINKILKFC